MGGCRGPDQLAFQPNVCLSLFPCWSRDFRLDVERHLLVLQIVRCVSSKSQFPSSVFSCCRFRPWFLCARACAGVYAMIRQRCFCVRIESACVGEHAPPAPRQARVGDSVLVFVCLCPGVPVNSRVSTKIQQLLNTLKRPKRPPLSEFFVDDSEEIVEGETQQCAVG